MSAHSHKFTERRDEFTPAPFALTADELDELAREDMAVARLAFASGCSRSTFAAIFGPVVDLSVHNGWRLAMDRGDWTATKGARTLRAATLGGIHAKVKKATRSPLPRRLPRTDSTPTLAFEARDGEGSHAHERSVTGMVS